jgi:hypothetical protein
MEVTNCQEELGKRDTFNLFSETSTMRDFLRFLRAHGPPGGQVNGNG